MGTLSLSLAKHVVRQSILSAVPRAALLQRGFHGNRQLLLRKGLCSARGAVSRTTGSMGLCLGFPPLFGGVNILNRISNPKRLKTVGKLLWAIFISPSLVS